MDYKWEKGRPNFTGYYWIKWFVPSWMDVPMRELAHYHEPSGEVTFFSDEPKASRDMLKVCCIAHKIIPIPELK